MFTAHTDAGLRGGLAAQIGTTSYIYPFRVFPTDVRVNATLVYALQVNGCYILLALRRTCTLQSVSTSAVCIFVPGSKWIQRKHRAKSHIGPSTHCP